MPGGQNLAGIDLPVSSEMQWWVILEAVGMLQRHRPLRALFSLVFLILVPVGLKAGPIAWATLQTTGTDTFGTLDLNTGVFTPINSSEPSELQLASFGGNLYALQETGNALYQVNPATGSLTSLGSLTLPLVIGSTSSGLYDVDEILNLNSLDPSSGAATSVGATGTPGFENWYALSNSGSALYMGVENTLYTVNATTGSASAVGNYGIAVAGQPEAEMGALLFEGGVLYGAQEGEWIDTIDPATGLATNISTLQGIFAGEFIYGLAPDVPASATPEPATAAVLAIGLAALCARRFRSKAPWRLLA
jgi:hypothetical protein